MEDGTGEETNPFSFKSFVQANSVDPPPYPSNIDKKEKKKNRSKGTSKARKKDSFDEEAVPFPEVNNLKLDDRHPEVNSTKSSQELFPGDDEASNGEK